MNVIHHGEPVVEPTSSGPNAARFGCPPEARRSRPQRRTTPSRAGTASYTLILPALLVLGGTVAAYAQGRGPAAVVVMPLYEDDVPPSQEFVGTVTPEQRAVIGSAVDGRVVEFPVNEGDRVMEREPLAQLLIETISKEVEAAEAELTLRKYELEELQNGSRPEEKEQADAFVSSAQALMTLAERRLARVERLMKTPGAVTEDDLDGAQSRLDEARALLTERTAAQRLIILGPRAEKILQAQAKVAMQQAVLDRLLDQKTKHTIISRFDGYVVAEHTEVGAWVNRGGPVAEIVGLDRVEIQTQVLESYIPYLEQGMQVEVRIPALPDEFVAKVRPLRRSTTHLEQEANGTVGDPGLAVPSQGTPESVVIRQPFVGEVVHIVPAADERSRTFPVKVRVSNVFTGMTPVIKAGMLARVTLPTGPVRENVRLVPKDAVVLGGATPAVWVVDLPPAGAEKPGEARPVPVRTGIVSGTQIEVIPLDEKSISLGSLVVVEGNERLQPKAPVVVLKQLAPPPGPVRENHDQ